MFQYLILWKVCVLPTYIWRLRRLLSSKFCVIRLESLVRSMSPNNYRWWFLIKLYVFEFTCLRSIFMLMCFSCLVVIRLFPHACVNVTMVLLSSVSATSVGGWWWSVSCKVLFLLWWGTNTTLCISHFLVCWTPETAGSNVFLKLQLNSIVERLVLPLPRHCFNILTTPQVAAGYTDDCGGYTTYSFLTWGHISIVVSSIVILTLFWIG